MGTSATWPLIPPTPPPDPTPPVTGIPSFMRMLEFVLPPWLLRTEGMRLVGALADVIDDHRNRMVAGVKLRFPGLYTLEGIDQIGRERKLRRGPSEDADVFALRLRRWWQDHQTRGNANSLLAQMLAYFDAVLDAPFDVVSYRGVRHTIDSGGRVTRDTITWSTDESGLWAQVWVFLYVSGPVSPGDLGTIELCSAIVRDWMPAHVAHSYLVFISPDVRLWDYPQPVPDWADEWDWSDGPTISDVVEV